MNSAKRKRFNTKYLRAMRELAQRQERQRETNRLSCQRYYRRNKKSILRKQRKRWAEYGGPRKKSERAAGRAANREGKCAFCGFPAVERIERINPDTGQVVMLPYCGRVSKC